MAGTLRVLFIDDSADDALLMERELSHSEFQVHSVRVDTEPQLRDVLGKEQFDVVLADYNLPEFSALKALQVMQESHPDVPVLIVSGNLGEETAVKLMRAGARDYLMKNNLTRLGAAVERELDEARSRRDKRQAEEERLIGARLWQETFDSISDMVLVMDTRHRILQANRSAMEILGGDVVGKRCFEVLHGTESVPAGCVHMLCMKTGTAHQREYNEAHLGNRWFDARIFPIRDDRGRIVRVVHTFRDISERRNAEKQLAEKEQQLRQLDKLQAIGQLAGGIAHDFNNQLTGIMGYADILTMHLKEPQLLNCAQEIVKAATRSADLTAKLLSFSRKGNFMTSQVDLNSLIGEVYGILRHSLDKRITIVANMTPEKLMMKADHTQIQSALLNLCINSRDAMPEGGVLTITSEVVMLDADQAAISELASGRYALISVKDTGEGITPDIYEKIFDPFFTTKPVGKGTGLGLSAVYGTVKAHCGTVDFSSSIGAGTTFRIYLPLDIQPTSFVPEKGTSGEGSGHILVVDDETAIRAVTTDLLRELGYKVTPFGSGEEALAFYSQNWQKIDLILLDVVLREGSGKELFRKIREVCSDARIILASGYNLTLEISELLASGYAEFIQKPYQHNQLSWRIHSLLSRS